MNAPTPGEEAARQKRQGAEQAIQLALESKWEEAVALNRAILEAHDADVDAWNRLGKALLELGRYKDAREAYGKSIGIDPVNSIAKRNLDRLSQIDADEQPRREATAKVAQDLFIEEIGKTGVSLLHGATPETLATLTAGDEVYLKTDSGLIEIANIQGQVIGSIEPKMGLRLKSLIDGGNKYAAAVKSVSENNAELIIKEVYRDPAQTKISFPTIGGDVGRAYVKESLLRLGDDDDDDVDDDTDREDWDGEAETPSTEQTVTFSSLKIERDTEEEEEE